SLLLLLIFSFFLLLNFTQGTWYLSGKRYIIMTLSLSFSSSLLFSSLQREALDRLQSNLRKSPLVIIQPPYGGLCCCAL
ncbi:hypothetical protein PJI17_31610, partial [Mycobacterium kansasii]